MRSYARRTAHSSANTASLAADRHEEIALVEGIGRTLSRFIRLNGTDERIRMFTAMVLDDDHYRRVTTHRAGGYSPSKVRDPRRYWDTT